MYTVHGIWAVDNRLSRDDSYAYDEFYFVSYSKYRSNICHMTIKSCFFVRAWCSKSWWGKASSSIVQSKQITIGSFRQWWSETFPNPSRQYVTFNTFMSKRSLDDGSVCLLSTKPLHQVRYACGQLIRFCASRCLCINTHCVFSPRSSSKWSAGFVLVDQVINLCLYAFWFL